MNTSTTGTHTIITFGHQLKHLAGRLVVSLFNVESELLEVGVQVRRVHVGSFTLVHLCARLKRPVVDDDELAAATVIHAVAVLSVHSTVPRSSKRCRARATANTQTTHIINTLEASDRNTSRQVKFPTAVTVSSQYIRPSSGTSTDLNKISSCTAEYYCNRHDLISYASTNHTFFVLLKRPLCATFQLIMNSK